jgi:hypothetical protein
MFIEQFVPNVCVSFTGITELSKSYVEYGDGSGPTLIAVNPKYIEYVYELYAESPSLTRVLVVPMPGMDEEFWFVGGPRGIVWSDP